MTATFSAYIEEGRLYLLHYADGVYWTEASAPIQPNPAAEIFYSVEGDQVQVYYCAPDALGTANPVIESSLL